VPVALPGQQVSGDEPEDTVSDATALKVKAPARVAWSQHPERTERLLDYLDGHRNLASQLFADDTQAAKLTAEEIKRAYSQIAHHVFYHDDEVAVQVDVRRKPQKYATSVKNYIYTYVSNSISCIRLTFS
jgi:hypothetical protein